ncbi:MAG: hypothetical protein ACLFU2_03630 [Opitutales bacterium]
MEIISNAAGRVDYFPIGNFVMESLYGRVRGKEMREIYVAGLECVREHNCRSWLSESRSLLPLEADDAHWISWTWFPQMQALGWRNWAIIRPVSALAMAGLQDSVQNYRALGVQVEMFDDIGEALRWLRPEAAVCQRA